MKRIFIGLKISKRLQAEITRWQKRHIDLPIRWIAGKNLHITLIPPFYARNIKTIAAKLKAAKFFSASIVAELDKISFGPDPKRPRLIWATGKTPENLLNLKKYLHKILKKKSEKRSFSLHLTLARFRPREFRRFTAEKINKKIFWREAFESIALFESKLSPKGAVYEVLREVKLRK
jgi:2'-5' RNA ligase